ncbi:uncharacterized protein LOC118200756 isoform X2 [Stegodyphus dumicola]|uniref:uncharacterized protein LOC118200756 isoform X1 n=1 Tax=Stegodyphus dumicola TaxID=202533 RepID=UPI0015AFF432|nr:uncharacterized protein LOC118200756 isoform X1 [Stegodyphus dumicola]XP_035228615.1 uncharacterized protein LOC118200756 isoform X2 [Stegodyphus dumicola]
MAYSAFFIPLFLFSHIILANSFPQPQPDFHTRLNKSQLKKYFSVDEHEKVPEYNLVNIRMRRSSMAPIEKRSSTEPAEVEPSTDILIQTDSIFGHAVQLQLRRNNLLLAPSFKAIKVVDNEEQELPQGPGIVCHYVGYNGSIGAALSNCAARGFSGMFLLPDGSVQVQPVEDDLAEILELSLPQDKSSQSEEEILHLVFKPNNKKRLSVPDGKRISHAFLPRPYFLRIC